MIYFFSIVLILVGGYVYFREGIFTAVVMCVNVIAGGIVAFHFFEPLAGSLAKMFSGSFMAGTEDFLSLILIFSLSVGLLRLVANRIVLEQLDFTPIVQQFGGAAVGAFTGYLVCGFLLVSIETLPLHHNFMGFQPRTPAEGGLRRVMPPDRIWLGMMRHAGAFPFARAQDRPYEKSRHLRHRTFDRSGSFEIRYLRYRRFGEDAATPYRGEFQEILE